MKVFQHSLSEPERVQVSSFSHGNSASMRQGLLALESTTEKFNPKVVHPKLNMTHSVSVAKFQNQIRDKFSVSFPLFLHPRSSALLSPPKTRFVGAKDDIHHYIWGGRNLLINFAHMLGAGRNFVYFGQLNGKPVAIKVGQLPELKLLKQLLLAQQKGLKLIVPLPMMALNIPPEICRALTGDESGQGIEMAVMPFMHTTLEKYLSQLALHSPSICKKVQNRLCPQADALIAQLYEQGIDHGDAENSDNFLIPLSEQGQVLGLFVSDFGNAKLVNNKKY